MPAGPPPTMQQRVSTDWPRPVSALMPSHYAGRQPSPAVAPPSPPSNVAAAAKVWCGCGFESEQYGLPEVFQSMATGKGTDLQKVAGRVWSRIRKNRMDRARARIGNVESTKNVARRGFDGLRNSPGAHSRRIRHRRTRERRRSGRTLSCQRRNRRAGYRDGWNLRAARFRCQTDSARSGRNVLVSTQTMLSMLRA
jgi:hypothetical protein